MADEGGTPLRALFAKFFVQWDTNGFNAGVRAVDGLFGKLQQLGQALVGGAIVGGMVALTRSVIHQGDELATTAERLGIATTALQEWQYAADLSDVSTEEMNAGLKFLQRNLFEASQGGKEAVEAFTKLGVQVKDAKGETISTEGALEGIADRFKEMTNPVEKTALAMKVFGRGGAALVPLLSRGREGIAELREEFHALGGGLNDETIEAANQADDAFKRLRLGVRSLIFNAMTPFIKIATTTATWLKNVIVQFRQWERGSSITKASLIALTVVAVAAASQIFVAWLPLIAVTLAWTAALVGAIIILDDIMTFFRGGHSVIGDWIDNAFGDGSSAKVRTFFGEAWERAKEVVGALWEKFQELWPEIKATVGVVVDSLLPSIQDVVRDIKDMIAVFEGAISVYRKLRGFLGESPLAIGARQGAVSFRDGPGRTDRLSAGHSRWAALNVSSQHHRCAGGEA